MKFSLVNGERLPPFPKGRGICPVCGYKTVARCGTQKIWHWAHRPGKECDKWWESETEWHRDWKEYWPDENQEVVHFDEETGEKHIADVKNDNAVVIEFQNSPLALDELRSRELFYKNMIWIVNAEKFQHNIKIGGKLPNPNNEEFKEICLYSTLKNGHWIFYRRSDERDGWRLCQPFPEIEDNIESSHIGHYSFSWKRPKKVWLNATKPVLFDFGYGTLWNLCRFTPDKPDSFCLRKYNTQQVISLYGGMVN